MSKSLISFKLKFKSLFDNKFIRNILSISRLKLLTIFFAVCISAIYMSLRTPYLEVIGKIDRREIVITKRVPIYDFSSFIVKDSDGKTEYQNVYTDEKYTYTISPSGVDRIDRQKKSIERFDLFFEEENPYTSFQTIRISKNNLIVTLKTNEENGMSKIQQYLLELPDKISPILGEISECYLCSYDPLYLISQQKVLFRKGFGDGCGGSDEFIIVDGLSKTRKSLIKTGGGCVGKNVFLGLRNGKILIADFHQNEKSSFEGNLHYTLLSEVDMNGVERNIVRFPHGIEYLMFDIEVDRIHLIQNKQYIISYDLSKHHFLTDYIKGNQDIKADQNHKNTTKWLIGLDSLYEEKQETKTIAEIKNAYLSHDKSEIYTNVDGFRSVELFSLAEIKKMVDDEYGVISDNVWVDTKSDNSLRNEEIYVSDKGELELLLNIKWIDNYDNYSYSKIKTIFQSRDGSVFIETSNLEKLKFFFKKLKSDIRS